MKPRIIVFYICRNSICNHIQSNLWRLFKFAAPSIAICWRNMKKNGQLSFSLFNLSVGLEFPVFPKIFCTGSRLKDNQWLIIHSPGPISGISLCTILPSCRGITNLSTCLYLYFLDSLPNVRSFENCNSKSTKESKLLILPTS